MVSLARNSQAINEECVRPNSGQAGQGRRIEVCRGAGVRRADARGGASV